MLNLNDLGRDIQENGRAHGWDVPTLGDWPVEEHLNDKRAAACLRRFKIPAHLALIHTEVSEAVEAFRVGDFDHFAEELADIIIRVLDLSAGLEIDIEGEIVEKVDKNRERSHRHGGKIL